MQLFRDVVFRLAPIGRNKGRRMSLGIYGYQLLKGFRGKPPVDVETIERLLASLSPLAINHPEIKEMDINRLLVHSEGQGATVPDCRMMLFDGSEG